MAADAALINSFERLATSGQRDYSGQLQAQREQGRITQKGFTDLAGILSEKSKSEHDVTMEAYKEQNKKTKLDAQQRRAAFDKTGNEQALEYEEGGGLPEEFADEVKRLTRVAGNDFKAANPEKGKDTDELKDARAEATKKLQDIEKLIVKTRTLYQTETTTSNASPDEVLGRISKVRDIDNHPDVSMEIVDGEAVYTFKSDPNPLLMPAENVKKNEEKYTMDQLLEQYVPEATESQTEIYKVSSEFGKRGEEKGGVIPPSALENGLATIKAELVKDPKILADMSQRACGFLAVNTGQAKDDSSKWEVGSVAYSFQNDPSLNLAMYEAAGVEVPDLDGDDTVVSKQEAMQVMMDTENRDIIISTIVDPFYINPITGKSNYDHDLSAQLIANRIGEEAKKKFEIGSAHYQANLAERKGQGMQARILAEANQVTPPTGKNAEDYLNQ